MKNTQSLLNLVDRAERGVLLAGEAAILRDAIANLADMAAAIDTMCACATGGIPVVRMCPVSCGACGDHAAYGGQR